MERIFEKFRKHGNHCQLGTKSQSVNKTENGDLALTPEGAVELGLRHSREYQSESEDLYLAALAPCGAGDQAHLA